MRKLYRFHGGVKLEDFKDQSTAQPIARAPIPKTLVLPLQQHIGEPAQAMVKVGDKVFKGQRIAQAQGSISANIHASSSGTVIAIEDRPATHPSGLPAPAIIIETDGRDTWTSQGHALADEYESHAPADIRKRVAEAGIVGLGGAGFPTAIKLSPLSEKVVDTLILNGAECEPYISCDDMLMREYADQVVRGALIMAHALHARHIIIAIEDNKPRAIAAMRTAAARLPTGKVEICAVPSIYPTGGERQLIRVLTGTELPAHTLPIETGIVCHNVATAAAVYQAIYKGRPLLSRIVTVTGHVQQQCNLEVALGTPVADIIAYCGGDPDNIEEVTIGGPMMGYPLRHLNSPVIKTCNCVLVKARQRALPYSKHHDAMPCIRCGACADACPVELLPQQMYWHARAREFDRVQDYNLFDCIECGCCDYVCPSHIPLVQYYRFAKTEIWAQEREKRKSDQARQRHEFKQARLEREKAERAERHRRKAAKLQVTDDKGSDLAAKKAAIQAAVERVKAKKNQASVAPRNVENLTEQQKQLIAEVDARRTKARQQRRQEPQASEPNKQQGEQ